MGKEDCMYSFDEVVERRGTQCEKWDSVAGDSTPMWVADMDFPAPPAVLKALRERTEHGVFGYGITEDLPPVIAKWIHEEYGLAVDGSWIVLLPGTVPVLAAASHLREGRIMTHVPNYNGLLEAPLRAGKETILSPLRNTGEYYTMDYDDMRKRLAPDVRLFYLCNPHNPVGRVYTKEELLELSRFARENRLVVVSDEVHCGIVFDRPHIPYFSVDEYSMEQSITLMGPGKTFNLAGLPLGFAVIPNEKLRREFTASCYALPHPGVLSVVAAKAAYGESREWKNALVEYLRGNRDYFESRMRKAFPAAKMAHAEGTYLQWIDFRPLGIAEPFQWLEDNPKILASDGKIFGMEGYVRLNLGTNRARVADALDRIEHCAGELNPRPGKTRI